MLVETRKPIISEGVGADYVTCWTQPKACAIVETVLQVPI
jgi:hypothetical protein